MKKQKTLPGMEDRRVVGIERLALRCAEITDERAKLAEEESGLKTALLAEMKKAARKVYRHGSLEVSVVPKDEKVRVRVAEQGRES